VMGPHRCKDWRPHRGKERLGGMVIGNDLVRREAGVQAGGGAGRCWAAGCSSVGTGHGKEADDRGAGEDKGIGSPIIVRRGDQWQGQVFSDWLVPVSSGGVDG
jgi:hypothetical protein